MWGPWAALMACCGPNMTSAPDTIITAKRVSYEVIFLCNQGVETEACLADTLSKVVIAQVHVTGVARHV
jgi:hypothetical protein